MADLIGHPKRPTPYPAGAFSFPSATIFVTL